MPPELRLFAVAYSITAGAISVVAGLLATALVPIPGVPFSIGWLIDTLISATVLGALAAVLLGRHLRSHPSECGGDDDA